MPLTPQDVEALFERSKFDHEIIVGSEVRMLCGALRSAWQERDEVRASASATEAALRGLVDACAALHDMAYRMEQDIGWGKVPDRVPVQLACDAARRATAAARSVLPPLVYWCATHDQPGVQCDDPGCETGWEPAGRDRKTSQRAGEGGGRAEAKPADGVDHE